MKMKTGDKVTAPHGTGTIIQLYWSHASGKPYSAKVILDDGREEFVFLCEIKQKVNSSAVK